MDELLRVTTMAFCLSLQSLWERQLRDYLHRCAQDLKAGEELAHKARSASWGELSGLFLQLRGISLKDFEQYAKLNLPHLLGNACRHGNGPSLKRLATTYPQLWPQPKAIMPVPFFRFNLMNIIGILNAAQHANFEFLVVP